MTVFTLPDLGEGLHEAEIVAWHVGVGDRVVADQPLLSVETDKAVVDIPAPQAGRIARLLVSVGERAEIGQALVEFEQTDARPADAGSVVGRLSEPVAPESPPAAPPAAEAPGAATTPPVRVAPAVRALAQRLGVDLAALAAAHGDRALTRADVEDAAVQGWASPGEELAGVRRVMAQRMAAAHAQVVPSTVTDDVDIHDWTPGQDMTVRLLRAITAGARAEPALNTAFDGARLKRHLNDAVHVGIAVDTPEGLFVPVLRDVDRRSADDLRAGLERMKADVRARTIPPEELRGQTISLSNFGMFAGRYAEMVVVPPQVAILGAGKVRDAVVAHNGKPEIRRLLPLSLTFDHRAVSGGEAIRFLAAVMADLARAQ